MSAINDIQAAIARIAAAREAELVAVRRDLHAHPELAFEEVRTAGVVADMLGRLGIPHRTGVGRTGVIATIEGARPGPTIALRADMDALPIAERTGLDFASTAPGKMHACGHDVHTATLLGVAAILDELKAEVAGTVRLIFQPAEEVLGGARAMIADGALDGVSAALGFHNHPEIAVGHFAAVEGATYAACDTFRVVVAGRSGHAAYPHTTVDPVLAAAHFLCGVQSVVSRETDPLAPCVVTVGSVHGGTVHNIVPDAVVLLGTVRTLDAAVRDAAEAAVRRHAAGIDAGFRTRSEVEWMRGVPPTVNDGAVLARARDAVSAQLGDVFRPASPSMGAEDFAEFAARVPSFVLRVGSGAPGRDDHLHNSDYQPDERAIALGAQALARSALELLRG